MELHSDCPVTPPESYTISIPHPARVMRRLLLPFSSMLVGAALVAGALAIHDADGGGSASVAFPTYTAPGNAFRMRLPQGWQALGGASASGAALRRLDGRGTILVQRTTVPNESVAALARNLTATLRKRFKSFKPVSVRLVPVGAASGLLYTFVSGRSVHTVALTGTHGRAYAIDAVLPVGASDVAQQVGQMIGSFGS